MGGAYGMQSSDIRDNPCCTIPYSGKFLWENIFANFADTLPFAKIFLTIFSTIIIPYPYILGAKLHTNFSHKNSNFKTFVKIFGHKNVLLYGIL